MENLQRFNFMTWPRPYGTERWWLDKFFIQALRGAGLKPWYDKIGNLICDTTDNPSVLFCAHADTVHRSTDREQFELEVQELSIGTIISRKGGGVLGADDALGCYILRSMAVAGVPGRYIWHVGEERGCIGSKYISEKEDWLLVGIDQAISFDRKGLNEVITHQMAQRCASDAYAWALAFELGMGYVPSDAGMYTDSAEYVWDVPECVNIAVGYENEHTKHECFWAEHVDKLIQAAIRLDWGSLPIERDPEILDDDDDEWLAYWREKDEEWDEYLEFKDKHDFGTLKVVDERPDLTEILADPEKAAEEDEVILD